MKAYQISTWGTEIKEIEVIRKSESSIWIMRNGHESRQGGQYTFDTWELAKTAIVVREQVNLNAAINRMKYCEQEYQKALSLTPPK